MRMTANVRMDGYWIDEVVVFTVEVVELIDPEFFNIFRVDPAVAIGRFLDEHHRRSATMTSQFVLDGF